MADPSGLKLPSLERLQSIEQTELLDAIDSLRAQGLSEIVALPQLIVCGDQSSGKSSVLEAISGIPFPRQDTLCTRFATEVVLRRAAKDEISISILPGKDRTQNDRNRLLRFRHELKTKDDFGDLFETATEAMGLSSASKSFSNDVLRIEFCGPSQPQLTLVDLPGLIHSETKSQTAGDVKLVHSLVSHYLENPRSIILAVVSAKNDISNQIILRIAREIDKKGSRTLGIITKPDTLVKGSRSEEAFIALARNEEIKFSLGWHVVKNLDSSTGNNQHDARDEQEALYFKQSSFNSLPHHTVGIAFLRSRLSKVLFDQIRRELPRLVEDIQCQISAGKVVQDKLGPSRAETDDQKSFLMSLSQSFQSICRDAVRGDYDHEFFQHDTNPERRLCASIMNMHFTFAENMRKHGASWVVQDEESGNDRYRTREEAIKEACTLLKRSRGRELPGLPNPLLVGELFREYSRPWGDLARVHIKNVWEATNRFLELLLKHLTDDDACEKILRYWIYPIMEDKLNSAHTKLNELLEVHKDYPMTTNNHFINNSKKFRQDSSKDELEKRLKQEFVKPGQKMAMEEISRILSTIGSKANLDMDMVAAEEAFDNMNAFYEVAILLFTDNVPTLAIQAPIIREVPKILCPTAVFSMNADVVKRIAEETEEKTLERDAILHRLTILENGARICKQYAKRPQSFTPPPKETKELEVVVRTQQKPEQKSETAHPNPGSTEKNIPLSVPVTAIFGNPSSHVAPPVSLNSSSSDVSQKSGQKSGPLFPVSATPFGTFASTSANPSNGIFGSLASKNSGTTSNDPFKSSSPQPKSPWSKPVEPISLFKPTAFGTDSKSAASDSRPSPPSAKSGFSFGLPATSDPIRVIDTTQTAATLAEAKSTHGSTFQPYKQRVPSNIEEYDMFYSIVAMPEFRNYSQEELRLADYAQERKRIY